jgi:hypothetical protein
MRHRDDQLHTFAGSCQAGKPTEGACVNVQASVFPA